MPQPSQSSAFDTRAAEHILYRVRVRLVAQWCDMEQGFMWRSACSDAIGVIDWCLTQLRKVRRV